MHKTQRTGRCAAASWTSNAAKFYRGPEEFIDIPTDPKEAEEAIDDALVDHPDNDDVMSAVVLQANPKMITAIRQNSEVITITGEGLHPAQSGLSDKAPPNIRLRRGAVIRIVKTPKNTWEITQLPEVEGAFVALDPRDGSIKALVGGFDFEKKQIQPRAASLATTRLEFQTLYLFRCAGKRLYPSHCGQ